MTFPPDFRLPQGERGSHAVLSAIGALLSALGAGEQAAAATDETPVERVLPRSAVPPSLGAAHPGLGYAATTPSMPSMIAGPTGEASVLLQDARARAEAIIEDSIERAGALLRPEAAHEQLRLAVTDLANDVRGVHQRLDTIESLLRGEGGLSPAARPMPPSAPPSVPPVPPVAVEPIPPSPPVAPAPPPEPLPPPVSATPSASEGPFEPADGPVTVRISPIAGFQGLMRIQDALVRVPGVHEAGVQAYAQGEAQLRLHLDQPLTADALATGLAVTLGRAARVSATTAAQRTMHLVLD